MRLDRYSIYNNKYTYISHDNWKENNKADILSYGNCIAIKNSAGYKLFMTFYVAVANQLPTKMWQY